MSQWKQFLTAQARGIIAAGFAHVGTVLLRHLRALIVIEHGTRRVTASEMAVYGREPYHFLHRISKWGKVLYTAPDVAG